MAYEVTMPRLDVANRTATITHWEKKEGDLVSKGEPLLTVETEKVNVSVESPASGRIERIVGQEGQEYKVGDLIAVISETS